VVTGEHSDGGVRPGSVASVVVEYSRDVACEDVQSGFLNADCTGYADGASLPDCGDEAPLPPVFARYRAAADAPWGRWSLWLGWACPRDALPVLTAAEFRRLPIAPSVLNVQPDAPQVLVNMPTIVFTDPAMQSFTTALLGFPVEVEATPTRFVWDFGDGSDPIVTTSPGHPYPDQDVSYPYPRVGTYVISVTTEFTGRYRVAGTTTWLAVAGTATTATTSDPIEAVEARAHLVTENCNENPDGPGCND